VGQGPEGGNEDIMWGKDLKVVTRVSYGRGQGPKGGA